MKNFRHYYIIRMFAILLALFFLLLCATGIGIYYYARKTVGDEFRRLNQASLTQLAEVSGKNLSNVSDYTRKVGISSRILSDIENPDEDTEKRIHNVLSDLQSEFTISHTDGRLRIETSVIGKNDIFSSASNTKRLTLTALAEDQRLQALINGDTDLLILPTEKTGQSGIMNYSFQIITSMRNLLTEEWLGFAVVDVSELLLYEQYRDFLKGDLTLSMITSDGQIISDKNKQMINSQYSMEPVQGQILLIENIPGTDWLLAESIPENLVFSSLIKLRNVVFLAVIITTVLFASVTYLVSKSVLFRVMRLRNKMQQVMEGDLTVRINEKRDDEFGQIEQSFNGMVSEIDHLITRIKESEHEKRMAEMDFLNAQINSHFIHNTLTSIRFMLEMGQVEDAGEMIYYFSKLLRKTLSRSDEFIPLSEEIDTLKSYVMLQRFRYPNKFDAVYDIAENTLNALVPTLILQPIVENAVFHAMGHEMTHIVISSKREKENLLICVEDDGVGMTKEKQSSILKKDAPMNRVGVRNVHDRIQLNYGTEYGLNIISEKNVGTRVEFLLPYKPRQGDVSL